MKRATVVIHRERVYAKPFLRVAPLDPEGFTVYYVHADNDSESGAPWSLGLCGIEAQTVCSNTRISSRTVMYMVTRIRGAHDGKPTPNYKLCIWQESGKLFVRIGGDLKALPQMNLPIERQEFIEWVEDRLDVTFPVEEEEQD